MKIVVVGGSSSNVGKTTIACRLLSRLPWDERWAAMKVSVTKQACETRVRLYQRDEEDNRHKDTGRLLDAGAACVVWVTVWRPRVRSGLAAGLQTVRSLDVDGVVIESTSAGIELSRIDTSWFVAGRLPWKPWAYRHLQRADHVLQCDAPTETTGGTARTAVPPVVTENDGMAVRIATR